MTKQAHVVGIDAVRFAAAALVLVFHLGFWSWHSPADGAFRAAAGLARFPELSAVSWFGWIGVEIFFVISGYVIAFSAAGAAPLEFAKSRFLRLYPAAWLCGSLTAIVVLMLALYPAAYAAKAWLRTMLLLPIGPKIDGVYWTLSVEIAFYAMVFGLLAVGQFKRLEAFAWTIALTSLGYWLAGDALRSRIPDEIASLGLLRHGCFFALGIGFWLANRHGLNLRRVGLFGVCIAAGYLEIRSVALPRAAMAHASALVPFVFWVATLGAIAASIRFNARLTRLLTPAALRALRTLGLLTYPLYLIHDVLGCAVLRLAPFIGRWSALFLAATAVLGLAFACIEAERPIRHALLRLRSPFSFRTRGSRPATSPS